MIITIDGPAGSGKSTTARAVARALGFLYLDTGAMYRAVALAYLRAHGTAWPAREAPPVPPFDLNVWYDEGSMRIALDGEDVSDAIRLPEVSLMASRVSALPAVRERLVAEQQRLGRKVAAETGGVVLEGRDTGTVVFPDADVKVFLTADPQERARRRLAELEARGQAADAQAVLDDILLRDRQDTERAISPLRKAEDAVEVDTSSKSIEEQVREILAIAERRRA